MDTEGARQIREQRAKDKRDNPLKVLSIYEGKRGARFSLNSGSYVTALDNGHYVCVHKKCIDARIATTATGTPVCEHIVFVREYDGQQKRFDAAYPERADNPFNTDVEDTTNG